MTGTIIRGIAGFYYVHIVGSGVYECKAKGIFRKSKTKPLVGDRVQIEILDEVDREGNIVKILPRTNTLIRPAVANVSQAMVMFAITDPKPHLNLLDRFLVMMESQNIPTLICFNKIDLSDEAMLEHLNAIYQKSGYPLFFISAKKEKNIEEVKQSISGKTTVLAGPSGVGKSSLINILQSDVQMETGSLSEKIARGKHTTRHAELIACEALGETFLVDTPGFSSLYSMDFSKEELKKYFPEFVPYEEKCRFLACVHMQEPNCGVKEALATGELSHSRYENYVLLFNELIEKEKRRYK